ncbi:MAG: flavin reductase family protein [Lachnospiraceae bacterium]|nr:flavin reductase family protein [Lachnospiraceae bacterium]
MRKNFNSHPWSYPQPVLMIASYDENDVPNLMNAAWGGISAVNHIAICVDKGHKTTANILKRGAFTVSMADEAHVTECDYVGIVSGDKVPDKFAKAGFHAVKSEFVDAPVVEELPMCLECKMVSYDSETEILVGEIVNICADEAVLTGGKIDPAKLRPITFDPVNNHYLALGAPVGNAFKDGLALK